MDGRGLRMWGKHSYCAYTSPNPLLSDEDSGIVTLLARYNVRNRPLAQFEAQ